jgi:outer membrane immunogenic protein
MNHFTLNQRKEAIMFTLRQFKPALPLGLLLLSSQAFSAAIVQPPAPAPKIWQGPYVGAFIGGAFGDYDTTLDVGTITATSYFVNQDCINALNQAGTGSIDQSAFIGGVKLGDDWVWDNFLLGAVVDFGAYSQDGDIAVVDAIYPDSTGTYTLNSTYETDWLMTLRARAGFQFTSGVPTRLYATGGMAMTHLEITNTFTDNTVLFGAGISDDSETKVGWTVGGGLEFQLTDNLSLDAEYLWVDFSSVNSGGTITNTAGGVGFSAFDFVSPFAASASLSSSIVKVGLNYRFDV